MQKRHSDTEWLIRFKPPLHIDHWVNPDSAIHLHTIVYYFLPCTCMLFVYLLRINYAHIRCVTEVRDSDFKHARYQSIMCICDEVQFGFPISYTSACYDNRERLPLSVSAAKRNFSSMYFNGVLSGLLSLAGSLRKTRATSILT